MFERGRGENPVFLEFTENLILKYHLKFGHLGSPVIQADGGESLFFFLIKSPRIPR